MKAVIELDVPDFQIGQMVRVYFPDSAVMYGKCEPASGWVSVTDAMPDLEERVLIIYEWTGVSGEKYREIAFDSFKTTRFLGNTPLFWMPLPELPEEVTGDAEGVKNERS